MTTKSTSTEAAARRSAAAKKSAVTRAAKAEAAAEAAELAPILAGHPGEPGPKPTTAVVGETLKCQSIDGEISLSLLVPYRKFKLVMNVPEEIDDAQMLDFLLEQVMAPEDAEKLESLRDGAETFKFAMAWMDALGERLGASLGKSGPSSS